MKKGPPCPGKGGVQAHAVLWQKESIKDLGTLGGPDSVAWFINEAGEIAGQSYTNSIPNPTTGVPTADPFFIGKDGKMQDIPNGFGGTVSFLAGLNNRGQIAGEFTLPGDLTSHPFLWDRGVLTDLGTFGADCGLPFAISDAGEVAGWACSPSGAVFAFLWSKNVLTNLGTVGGDSCTTGNALNVQGQVVGESSAQCSFSDGDVRAFLWQKGDPIVDLNTLILPGSPLYLQGGDSINDRGEIAGHSIMSNGDHHAYLAIPCDEGHPGVEGCDYSMVEAAAPQISPAVRNASSGTLPQSLMHRMNRYHFPGGAFGPRH
jgi:probable HAF family extracellular repeat protein